MKTGLDSSIEIENEEVLPKPFKQVRVNAFDRAAIRNLLKNGIWVYFILLIFEGALRKWAFPALATPLLVVRDPVAIWLLYIAWKYDELPSNYYIWIMSFISIIGLATALTIGHGSLVVAIYGTRILLFHFPLIFLIGHIFDRDDVIKMGKVLLWMSIPMLFLIALQFYSPQNAFINRGIGGDMQGGGFSGALGYYRPPGTFSFTTGNTQFFSFVAAFILYFWLDSKEIKRILLIAATVCLFIAIPLSISRNLFIQVGVTMLFATASVYRKPEYISRMLLAAIGLVIVFLILSKIEFFGKAIDALTSRFETASDSEGDIQDTVLNRILAGLLEPFQADNLPFFGFGIGMGTNAGAQLLIGRSDEFLISEGEWGRLIGEMGAILGMMAILLRLNLVIKLLSESFQKLKTDFLPWMLLSVSFQSVVQGQWAQPTALGFAILTGGLTIASLNNSKNTNQYNF